MPSPAVINPIRVVHIPTTVGGNPQGISKHLNELGVISQTWTITQNYLEYPADEVILKVKRGIFIDELKRLLALRYIFQADIIFFNFGTSLFPRYSINKRNKFTLGWSFSLIFAIHRYIASWIEFGLIKILRRKIFIQYQGDDARQGDFCRRNFDITFANRVDENYYNDYSDNIKRKLIKIYSESAEKVYALNPDLLHVLPESAEFLPYSHISLEEWLPSYVDFLDRPLRIGHAPSNRAVKGTEIIIDAVKKLRFAGFEFDFVLIEGIKNAEAKEIYRTLDVLVDQLFAGWYGGLAVEAMALGKPVVSYIRELDLAFIPEQMRAELPIIRATPESLVKVLKNVLMMPATERLRLGRQSRAYVERWHDGKVIAQRIKSDMEVALGRKI